MTLALNFRTYFIFLAVISLNFAAQAQSGSSKSTGIPKQLNLGYAFIDDNGSGSPTGMQLPGITLIPNTIGINFPLMPVGHNEALACLNVTLSGGSIRRGGRIAVVDLTGEYLTSMFPVFGNMSNATFRAGFGVSSRSYLTSSSSNLAVIGAGWNLWLMPERMALNLQGIGRYDLDDQDHFGQVSVGVTYRL
jgi:hypothetical protein